MARFTLRGHRGDREITLTWHDGQLDGDPDAVQLVQALARAYEGQPVAASLEPATTHDHLVTATSAYALMQLVFTDTPELVEGSVPGLLFDNVGEWEGPPEPPTAATDGKEKARE